MYPDSKDSSKRNNKEVVRYSYKDIQKNSNTTQQAYDHCMPQTR